MWLGRLAKIAYNMYPNPKNLEAGSGWHFKSGWLYLKLLWLKSEGYSCGLGVGSNLSQTQVRNRSEKPIESFWIVGAICPCRWGWTDKQRGGTPTSGTGHLRKDLVLIQSETGPRFIETIFSVIAIKKYNGVNPLDYIKSCIESFRLNRPAPRLIPEWCGPIPVAC